MLKNILLTAGSALIVALAVYAGWLSLLYVVDATLIILILGVVVYTLAWKDIFFTFVEEGEIVAIVEGKNPVKYIGNIDGVQVDPETGIVVSKPGYKTPLGLFGVSWIGIPPIRRRYKYVLRWNKFDKEEDGTDYTFIPRNEEVDSIYYKYPYAIRISGAETKDRLPVDICIVALLRTENAQTALFIVRGGYLQKATASIMARVRDWAGSMPIKDLTEARNEGMIALDNAGETPSNPITSFVGAMQVLNRSDAGNPSLAEQCGLYLEAVNFLSYDIVGPNAEEIQRSTVRAYTADQDAYAIDKTGTAEANVIAKKYAAMRENVAAAPLAFANAIENFKGSSLVLSDRVMPALPLGGDRKTDEKKEEK
ncbi:MAG TPA: hypothetical protein VFA52_00900 [Candidatus Paceibacterota bacterium]|nr:hypothetical protein [Candidatus Paceibacterota bacterium]